MSTTAHAISISRLALTLAPCIIVFLILHRWSLGTRTALHATVRMIVQLIAIGYVLAYLFAAQHSAVVLVVLTVMLAASCWISLRPLRHKSASNYTAALIAIAAGGIPTLLLVTQGVLQSEPWHDARIMIPLAGMVFSNAMNTVSLAAERLEAELGRAVAFAEARYSALDAALIPTLNSMFAVGLVALPGMMTGQILSGVSPLIAVRYQIMVMLMVFGASGIAAATYLALRGNDRVRAG